MSALVLPLIVGCGSATGVTPRDAVSRDAAPERPTVAPLADALRVVQPRPRLFAVATGAGVGHPRYHHAQSIQRTCDEERCVFLVSTSEPDAAGLWIVEEGGAVTKVALDTRLGDLPAMSHAGGIQLSGALLAVALSDRAANVQRPGEGCGPVPLAKSCRGAVMFFDVDKPRAPRRLAELDLVFDLCSGDTGWPARDVQAVGFVPSDSGWFAAVLVARDELQYFRFASGSWTRVGATVIPPGRDAGGHGEADWSWPSSINLYRDEGHLTLVTLGREQGRERVASYRLDEVTLGLALTGRAYLAPGRTTNMGAVGGSERDAAGALTIFAASEHFCDQGGCMCSSTPEIATYATGEASGPGPE